MSAAFKRFYSQSMDFRTSLLSETNKIPNIDDFNNREIATLILADISSEHGHAVHLLAKEGCNISASSLLRLQFESLIRAQWIYWVAKDDIVERFYKPLTQQNASQAEKRIPTINIILKDLDDAAREGIVPERAVAMMREFKELTMKPANSYVHTGMHAFSRKKDGFPEPLIIQILQNSNVLEALNAMLLATVVNSADMIQKVLALQYLYIDSLPMHIPQIMEKFYNMRYQ
ncbi:DUF6988 family protein [Psychrobacter piscatorii]|uniref:DUF6988 family protein n=1 Tax=Psychrobacter piscatorii TaxID=554343 RepID=UPI00191AB8CA|nr:hypothetical protein [Psychrobacter piscatorii]